MATSFDFGDQDPGPAPEYPGDYRLLGWDFSSPAKARFKQENSIYMLKKGIQAQREMNPLSVSQAQAILGPQMTQGLATPNEMTNQPYSEPSSVPRYTQPSPQQRFIPNTTPDTMVSTPNDLVPPTFDINRLQNPYPMGKTRGYDLPSDLLPRGSSYTPASTPGRGESMDVTYAPSMRPQFPNTTQGFQETQGPNIQGSREILNPNAPANPQMRNMTEAKVHAMQSPLYGRAYGNNNPLQTLNQKLALAEQDAIDSGMDPKEAHHYAVQEVLGVGKTQSIMDARKERTRQGDERLAQGRQRLELQSQWQKFRMNLDQQKQNFLEQAKQKGLDTTAADKEWDHQYKTHVFQWVTKNWDMLDDEARQEAVESLGSFITGQPTTLKPSTSFFGSLFGQKKLGLGNEEPVKKSEPAPNQPSGADEELAKMQALVDQDKAKYPDGTYNNKQFTIKDGKVTRNK